MKKVSRKFSLKRKAEKVCDICNLKTTVVLGNSGTTNKNIKTKIELCRTQITSHKGTVGISHEVKIFLCSLRWSAQGEGDSSFVNLSTPVPQFNKMSPQSNILLLKVLSSKNKGWFLRHQQNLKACCTISVDGSVRELILFLVWG